MDASVGERDTRARQEILHRARHDHLARSCECRDSGADVYSHARDLATDELALAGVQAGADGEPQLGDRVDSLQRASDRATGPVECGQEAVARCVDLDAVETNEL